VAAAVEHARRYFVDESMLSIARALRAVRPDVVYPGHPDCPDIRLGARDVDWLPVVGRAGWAVIMRDKRIRRRPVERQRLVDHGVRAFCLTGAGNQSSWQMLQLVVRHWDRIERVAAEPGPYLYALTTAGLRLQTTP
jgi:hypothetical protein